MLLPFFILQLVVAALANPFHKYPYVFLLDVGNEEIEKVNTEQIRLTIPGGSLALKYPATGEGDTIGHVRVSGIDFGTELKASIAQGGPGYKYVVLVFMGNPGDSYDAVVTIQTVPNTDDPSQFVSNMNSGDANQELKDDISNNSAEDTSDVEAKYLYSKNSQIMQSSSNTYEYSRHEGLSGQNNDDGSQNNLDVDSQDDNEEIEDNDEDDDSYAGNQNAAIQNDYSGDNSNVNDHVNSLNSNRYGKYESFKPFIIGGVRFYPQAGQYIQDGYSESIHDQENHFNEEGDDDTEFNNKDTNNNIEPDYGSPIDY
ncbi:unnamed protein product [Euphydryas editha]|uniref:Uncharacterized protein n=1 Tax=Euphydryas editha TaxID=104508 RepID=A0AAU9U3D1_EUPED|nr:unnamed protein product [Euphydryas editha]